jgi:hypothetical protein
MPVQNKTTTSEEYARVQGMLSGLTANVSVMAFVGRERIEALETAARADALMAELVGEFRDRLAAIGGAEAFEQMSKAYEAFAEANFAFEMLNRGVPLQRTAGTGGHGQKRPDFMHAHGKGPIHFEVKALDIAEPMFRHKEIAYEALEQAADLDERARKPGIHFSETEMPGYRPDMTPSERVDLVIARLTSALKRDQLRHGPTVLVVDLGRLPNLSFGPSALLPVFFHAAPPAESCVSGELWHIALGRMGERMFRLPQFDGASNLDGHLTRQGLLLDYPELVAITFVLPRWSGPAELFTIWNVVPDHTKLLNKLALSEDEVEDLLDRYSDGLNDTSNERGYDYRVCR